MNNIAGAKVGKVVELNGVVFPPCSECGAPYRPSKPIDDHGTVVFKSPDLLANTLYRIESFIRRLRRARIRSL